MAVSQEQKVDFLLKKLGFTKTKTGLAVDSTLTGTKKAGFAEAIPSPLIIANSSLWNEADSIPTTPPGSDTNQVKVYLAATSGHRMTVDSTVANNRAFIAFSTYNNSSSTRLDNWIDTQFGAAYLIKVFRGDPNSGGVQLSAAGSGNADGWFFDYSAGVLNFNDTNVPSGVTATNIYVVGYRYIGQTGAPTSGISTFSYSDLTVERNLDVGVQGGISTFRNNIDAKGILDVDGLTKLDDVNVSQHLRVQSGGGVQVAGITTTQVLRAQGGSITITDGGITETVGNAAMVMDEGTRILTKETHNGYMRNLIGKISDVISIGSSNTGFIDQINLFPGNAGPVQLFHGSSGTTPKLYTQLGGVKVNGTTRTDNLVVLGVTTSGNIDANGNIDLAGDLDVDGHTNLDNISVSGVSTFNGDANFGGNVSIAGTLTYEDVKNVDSVGIITARAGIDCNADLDVDGHTNLDNVSVAGISTFGGSTQNTVQVSHNSGYGLRVERGGRYLDLNGNWGSSGYGAVSASHGLRFISGTSSNIQFFNNTVEAARIDSNGNTNFYNDIDVDGHTNLDNVSVVGMVTVTNVSSGVALNLIDSAGKKFIAGGGGGSSPFAGSGTNHDFRIQVGGIQNAIFKYGAGATGNLELGPASGIGITFNGATGNVQIAGISTFANEIHLKADNKSLFIGNNDDLTFFHDGSNSYIKNTTGDLLIMDTFHAYIRGYTSDKSVALGFANNYKLRTTNTGVVVTGIVNATDLDIDGHTNLDNVSVAGVTTFSGVIEGVAGENKIPSLYSAMTNLPSAGSYHGMFAHVHATGRGYFAHAGNWLELVNKETNGTVGTGTETYSIGHITGTGLILNGDIDVDGHTNLDNVNIVGVATVTGEINIPDKSGNSNWITFGDSEDLKIWHSGTSGHLNNTTGQLYIQGAPGNNYVYIAPAGGGAALARFDMNGSGVRLYSGGGTKLITRADGVRTIGTLEAANLNVTGVSTFASTAEFDGTAKFDSTITAGGSTGTNGQYLRTTGAGVTWASFPTMRTSQSFTASAGQTTFSFTYNVGFLDVYVNGVKLSSSEFTANNGSSVVLAVGSFVGDIVELISYFTTSYAAGSDTGIENLVEDTSPQLGGNLDLFNKFITGTGGVSITGVITATSFSGTVPSSSLSGALPALDGSALTGIVASGSGVIIKNSGSTVGTAGTIDFGNNLSVSPVSAGIVTITGAAGGGSGLFAQTDVGIHTLSKVGIGTTNPTEILHIADSGNPKILIEDTESNNQVGIRFKTADYNWIAGIHGGIDSFKISHSTAFGSNDFFIINGAGNVSILKDLDVDGHTNLDNVSIAGVTTMTGNLTISNATPILYFIDTGANPDYHIKNNNGYFDIVDGTNAATRLSISNTGVITIPGNLNLNKDLDVDGHTNLDNVSVAGVTTFSSAITVSDIRNNSINLRNAAGGATYAAFSNGGAATLYFNNAARLATSNAGITVTGTVSATSFSGDGSGLTNLPGISTAHVRSETLTVSGVTTFTGDVNANKLKFPDSNGSSTNIALFGTDEDLKIYHSGADSFISDQGTGQLKILTSTLSVKNAGDSTVGLEVVPGSHTKLFFNGSNKIETTNTGAVVTGALTATSFVGDGSGLTGVVGSGSGVVVKDDGSTVGTAGTFDFTSPINITPLSAGITTVGIDTNQFNVNNLNVSGISTFAGIISLAEKIVHTDDTNTSINFPSLDTISFVTGGGTRLQVGPVGQLGIAGATYGNPGQVLTSQGSGSIVTWADPPNNVGITTNITGSFTATAGSPSEIHSFVYGTNDRVVEYTILIEQGSNFQTLKVLASRQGTTIHSTQFAVFFNSSLLAQFDVIISSSNIRLRATPETGVTGTLAYRIKREVM